MYLGVSDVVPVPANTVNPTVKPEYYNKPDARDLVHDFLESELFPGVKMKYAVPVAVFGLALLASGRKGR